MPSDFAVAIFRGGKESSNPLAKPERFELWSTVARHLSGLYPPPELLQMELRLRTGRAWEAEDGSATLVPLEQGSAVELEQMERLQGYQESLDAIKH